MNENIQKEMDKLNEIAETNGKKLGAYVKEHRYGERLDIDVMYGPALPIAASIWLKVLKPGFEIALAKGKMPSEKPTIDLLTVLIGENMSDPDYTSQMIKFYEEVKKA